LGLRPNAETSALTPLSPSPSPARGEGSNPAHAQPTAFL
jgi:hypothetical protein